MDVPFHGCVKKRDKLITNIPCSRPLFCGFTVTTNCLLLQLSYPLCHDGPCPQPWTQTKPSSLKLLLPGFCCSHETSDNSGHIIGVTRCLHTCLFVFLKQNGKSQFWKKKNNTIKSENNNNKTARKTTHSVSRLHICKERAIRIKKTKNYLTNRVRKNTVT